MLLLSRYALQRAVFYAFGVQRPHRGAEKPTRGRVSADGYFVAGHYFNLIFPLSALSLGFIP